MLNMPGSQIPGNRNSTPDANSASLRPPSSRTVAGSSHLRASADLSAHGPISANRIRPSSEFYGQFPLAMQGAIDDVQEKMAQQWIADIDQYETTLEEMAAATLDQEFKDELSAIEQWFRVLSEAERTAALYALLQQTTQVQIRFFIQVLQQMGKNHPMSSVLSPSNFDKDPMSSRLSDAMGKLNVESTRTSVSRPPISSATKRLSGLDSSMINAMFPDAAAAIATEKAKFTQQTGNTLTSNRNNMVHTEGVDLAVPPQSPWAPPSDAPKSMASQAQSIGQLSQTHMSGVLRSPLANNFQEPFSPIAGSWASFANTPSVPNFGNVARTNQQVDDIAMKLAALSTVNNGFALREPPKRKGAISSQQSSLPSPAINVPNMLALQNQQNPLSLNTLGRQQPGVFTPVVSGFSLLSVPSPSPYDGYLSDRSEKSRARSPRRATSKPPEDPTDINLLQDIPNWLRSLRLHKYTDNLKDLRWQDLIELDDKALEERGVNALGARRKMLKVFEQVKEAKTEGRLPSS